MPVLSGDEDDSLSGVEGPCSSDHEACPEPSRRMPIPDEIIAHTDAGSPSTVHLPPSNKHPGSPSTVHLPSSNKHPGWGGRRPGAGAPIGNLNALKHGLYSRRQAQILAAIVQVPGAQDALVAIAKRNRLRRKQAEEGMGVLLTRLLERAAALALAPDGAISEAHDQADNHDRNNQADQRSRREFLEFLNDTTVQMRIFLAKPSRLRRVTIKPQNPPGGEA